MKKEINALLLAENSTLRINKFCILHRWKHDAIGNEVDKLHVYFSFVAHYDYSVEIKSRDWLEIVQEVAEAQDKAFSEIAEKMRKNLLAGYIG